LGFQENGISFLSGRHEKEEYPVCDWFGRPAGDMYCHVMIEASSTYAYERRVFLLFDKMSLDKELESISFAIYQHGSLEKHRG